MILEERNSLLARIPAGEVTFHPHSHGDPAGRLFLWEGELYRGIRSQWAPFFTQLFQNGVIPRLVDRGLLIESEVAPLTLDGFDVVVRHRRVAFASYPEEWCAEMLRDAAVMILELATELAQYGLTLKDGHPWNVLFDGGRFVYVDLTSLIPAPGDRVWPGSDSFRKFCLYPLLLMARGQERIARRLLPEHEGVLQSELFMLTRDPALKGPPSSVIDRLRSRLRQRLPAPWRRWVGKTVKPMLSPPQRQPGNPASLLSSLTHLRREVEHITWPAGSPDYADDDSNSVPDLSSRDAWTAKEQAVYNILAELRPGSVLDMASGAGWWSRLAALLNSQVVALDAEPVRVSRLYHQARASKLPILPLVMDLADPTPARGLFGHWAIAAADRLQCDMVLALDLVHHMVFGKHLDFAHIAGGLAQFSKRWLVVEFVPSEDPEISQSSRDRCPWYTLDNFVSSLQRWFCSVTVLPSYRPSRVLLVCEK
jgi:SAM-dependent methyltransferase